MEITEQKDVGTECSLRT